MEWLVSLFVLFVLLVSLLAGLKEGAVKHFFNLVAVLIAIFIAGLAYHLIAGLLSFLSPCVVPLVPVGTFHPLVAVASPRQAMRAMPGAFFAIEGDAGARRRAQELAEGLQVQWFELEAEQMALYHAAAVMASNHAVGLWHASSRLLGSAGIDPARCQEVLLPLLRSTLDNVESMGLVAALTGPVRRGDPGTVAKHLRTIQQRVPELADLYRSGTRQAVTLARESAEDLQQSLDAIEDVIRRTES